MNLRPIDVPTSPRVEIALLHNIYLLYNRKIWLGFQFGGLVSLHKITKYKLATH